MPIVVLILILLEVRANVYGKEIDGKSASLALGNPIFRAMTPDDYTRLAIDCTKNHSCLLFADDSIPASQVGLFVPSRAFSLQQLKVYLVGFGLTDSDVRVIPLQERPKKAPLGGYVVTIPLPES